jgi:hypothetical protein
LVTGGFADMFSHLLIGIDEGGMVKAFSKLIGLRAGMVIGEFDVLSSVFTGCNPLDYKVRTSQGCVALAYEVDGFLNLNG